MTTTIAERIPRISWVTGVVHQGDAISETLLAELEALGVLARRQRRNLDARVFCRDTDVADTRLRVCDDWRAPLADPHFQTSDIYVFHFGVFNEIHDLLNCLRRDAVVVVWFHNITPPQYLPAAAEDLVFRSFQQVENFRVADLVLVNSEHTAQVLAPMALQVPVQIKRLFGPNALQAAPADTAPPPRAAGGPLRLLYCGRFVESKSVHTLLEALAIIGAGDDAPIELTLVGMRTHSDPTYIGRLQALAASLPSTVQCSFEFNVDTPRLHGLYRAADAFVMPSLHEGFGMPLIEAYSAGTPVLSTPNGALEEVADGLALHFQAGNSEALAACIGELRREAAAGNVPCARGLLPLPEWRRLAATHAARFSRADYVERFAELLAGWLAQRVPLTKSRAEALERLCLHGHVYAETAPAADPFQSAVTAAVLAGGVESAFKLKHDDGLRALLDWPFPGAPQGADDLAYWRAVMENKGGLGGLLRQLAMAPEVRSKPHRLQLAAFLPQQLRDCVGALAAQPDAAAVAGVLLASRLRLLAASSVSDAEFVRQVYRLVLQREPEEAGLGGYFMALRAHSMTRLRVIESFLESDEAKKLHGAALPKALQALAAAA
jgi:glycosyltransferase involved in cell wall biosynthesis